MDRERKARKNQISEPCSIGICVHLDAFYIFDSQMLRCCVLVFSGNSKRQPSSCLPSHFGVPFSLAPPARMPLDAGEQTIYSWPKNVSTERITQRQTVTLSIVD